MLAHGVEGNIADHDDLIGAHFEGGLEVITRILFEAAEKFAPRTTHPRGGVVKSLAVNVFANGFKKRTRSVFNALLIVAHWLFSSGAIPPSGSSSTSAGAVGAADGSSADSDCARSLRGMAMGFPITAP